jgi:hypothetical protein
MHVMDAIRSWGEPLIDEWAEKLGATCTSMFTAYSIDFGLAESQLLTLMAE